MMDILKDIFCCRNCKLEDKEIVSHKAFNNTTASSNEIDSKIEIKNKKITNNNIINDNNINNNFKKSMNNNIINNMNNNNNNINNNMINKNNNINNNMINNNKIINNNNSAIIQLEKKHLGQMQQIQKKVNELMQLINQKDLLINNLKNELQKKTNKVNTPNLAGLNNIGATCYMNATLQCLSNTKKLREYFLIRYNDQPNNTMSREFRKVLQNLWDKKYHKKAYSPNSFKEVLSKENPLFAGIQANDSKDLINFLIERFHQELNVVNNIMNNNISASPQDQTNESLMLSQFLKEFQQNFNSPISNLFYGLLETKSQCKGCKIIKYNFQIYSFLEFPLEQVNVYYYNMGKRPLVLPNNTNPDVDLYECFEYNRKIDVMGGENQMWCNICNKLCDAFYSSLLYSAPNYLIINLNRGKGAVYKCNVNFPEQLNIINFLSYKDENTVFDLYAVISHLGPSSMSGHFVAYCRSDIDYKWYLYNDSIVTECTKNKQYREGLPYILFYRVLKGGPNSAF